MGDVGTADPAAPDARHVANAEGRTPLRVLILAQYYEPEEVGAGIWITELAHQLRQLGHRVTVLTAFPNYPEGVVFPGYGARFTMREELRGIAVIRSWIHSGGRRDLLGRLLSFGSFCLSALLVGVVRAPRCDVVYAVLPPLPLGVSAWLVARTRRAALVTNIQDIYPHAAVALGVLRNRGVIRLFEAMERFVYRVSSRVVVISEGFQRNVASKGVARDKIAVISNWADSRTIMPRESHTAFRRALPRPEDFVLLYAGGLTFNSKVEALVELARRLRREPISLVIVGDGPRRPALEQMVGELGLENVHFFPFQPLERYGEVLASADLTAVTLHADAALVSVPSKIYKQMAAGRAVLAIAGPKTELAELVTRASCGFVADPDDTAAVEQAVRWAMAHPEEVRAMGMRGREYLVEHHDRDRCVHAIAETLLSATYRSTPSSRPPTLRNRGEV